MGYEEVEAERDAEIAALKRQQGRLEAMLEIQAWAKKHRRDLKHVGLYESLWRMTVPKK